MALHASGVTSNSAFQTVLQQEPRYRSRTLVSGGIEGRAGTDTAYAFIGAGPGAFRDTHGTWTSALAVQAGAVVAVAARAVVRAKWFGEWKRQWLVRGVKVGFGLRF